MIEIFYQFYFRDKPFTSYEWVQFLLALECLIATFAVYLLFGWDRWIIYRKYFRKRSLHKSLKKINALLKKKTPVSFQDLKFIKGSTFANQLRVLNYLLKRRTSPLSKNMFDIIYKEILALKIHSMVTSRWSSRRHLLLNYLKIGQNFEHINIWKKLINDSSPIIRLRASKYVIQYGHVDLFEILLNRIVLENRYVFGAIKTASKTMRKELKSSILHKIEKDKNLYHVKSCIDLIADALLPTDDISVILKRYDNSHINLKISIIRAVGLFHQDEVSIILKKGLFDSQWEVRAAAALHMGLQKDTRWLPDLKSALHDSAWWVRKNAAGALMATGTEGKKVLIEAQNDSDRYVREAAAEVLFSKSGLYFGSKSS